MLILPSSYLGLYLNATLLYKSCFALRMQAKTQKVQQEKAVSKILAGTQNIKGLEEKLQVWCSCSNCLFCILSIYLVYRGRDRWIQRKLC